MSTKDITLASAITFFCLFIIIVLLAFYENGILFSNPIYWGFLVSFLFLSALFLYLFVKECRAEKSVNKRIKNVGLNLEKKV